MLLLLNLRRGHEVVLKRRGLLKSMRVRSLLQKLKVFVGLFLPLTYPTGVETVQGRFPHDGKALICYCCCCYCTARNLCRMASIKAEVGDT
jgi:hypothetical protein